MLATYSTSKKGKVTVFQKSYPYSQVIWNRRHFEWCLEIVLSLLYLEMFVPFFFNERIVLYCDCVPHVIFLKNIKISTTDTLPSADIDINFLWMQITAGSVFVVCCHNPSPSQKSKVKRTSSGSILLLYHPPPPPTYPHKLFSVTRHPIELKFSQ